MELGVARVLERLVELCGHPVAIKSDNGVEFVATKAQEWIKGSSTDCQQNATNESFNCVFRDGYLNRSERSYPTPDIHLVAMHELEHSPGVT